MFTPMPRRSWPFAVVAVIALAFQQGWTAQEIIGLAVILLVFVALIHSAGGPDGE